MAHDKKTAGGSANISPKAKDAFSLFDDDVQPLDEYLAQQVLRYSEEIQKAAIDLHKMRSSSEGRSRIINRSLLRPDRERHYFFLDRSPTGIGIGPSNQRIRDVFGLTEALARKTNGEIARVLIDSDKRVFEEQSTSHRVSRFDDSVLDYESLSNWDDIEDWIIKRNDLFEDTPSKANVHSDSDALEVPDFFSRLLVHQDDIAHAPPEKPDHGSDEDPRWDQLEKFVAENPGKPIRAFAKSLFPELSAKQAIVSEHAKDKPEINAIALPKRAPERWPTNHDKRTENPAEFATRVYRPWMDAGVLARTDIKRLDPNLYAALNSWLVNNPRRKEPEPMPEGFRLLTKSESNDLWASKVREAQTGIANAGQAARLASLLHRRGQSKG